MTMTDHRHAAAPNDPVRHRSAGKLLPFLLGASLWLVGVPIALVWWPIGGLIAPLWR